VASWNPAKALSQGQTHKWRRMDGVRVSTAFCWPSFAEGPRDTRSCLAGHFQDLPYSRWNINLTSVPSMILASQCKGASLCSNRRTAIPSADLCSRTCILRCPTNLHFHMQSSSQGRKLLLLSGTECGCRAGAAKQLQHQSSLHSPRAVGLLLKVATACLHEARAALGSDLLS